MSGRPTLWALVTALVLTGCSAAGKELTHTSSGWGQSAISGETNVLQSAEWCSLNGRPVEVKGARFESSQNLEVTAFAISNAPRGGERLAIEPGRIRDRVPRFADNRTITGERADEGASSFVLLDVRLIDPARPGRGDGLVVATERSEYVEPMTTVLCPRSTRMCRHDAVPPPTATG